MKPQLDKIRAEAAFDVEFACKDSKTPFNANPSDCHFIGMCRENTRLTPIIEKLLRVIECQGEALEEVKAKVGICIFGSSDTSADPEVAYRQGSYQAWCDTGLIAKEAKAEVLRILEGERRNESDETKPL